MPTGIYEIHGALPFNELPDRGRLVNSGSYIPYLSLTKGEMRLALLAEQAKIYAKAFPEYKEYRKAADMLENALNAGVSRGVNFIGALHGVVLQQVAREIATASRQHGPASRAGIYGRKSIGTGIGDLIDSSKRLYTCLSTAGADPGKRNKCFANYNIEKIINDKIKDGSHHMLYKNLREADGLTATVAAKAINHRLGVEGVALVAELDKSIMDLWTENSIILKNSEKSAVGPLSSRDSAFLIRDNRLPKIGEPVTITVTIILAIISAAAEVAKEWIKAMRSQKAYAMAEVKGFGTQSYGPEDSDWAAGSGSGSNNSLLIGGAALAAYFLLNDN